MGETVRRRLLAANGESELLGRFPVVLLLFVVDITKPFSSRLQISLLACRDLLTSKQH